MKKIIPILIVGVLLLSGLGAVGVASNDLEQGKLNLKFSNIQFIEKGNSLEIKIAGSNSYDLRNDHYLVPTRIETYTYPFGTEITNVNCIPENIHSEHISKELAIAPKPVIAGTQIQKESKTISPVSYNSWFDYEIGTGMINAYERGVILKVKLFPVQYEPSSGIVRWAENINVDIKYTQPTQPLSFDDDYAFLILAPTDYSDELADLVTHKINRGITTNLVTLDEIYDGTYFPVEGRDNAEKIKYFIKNAIENWGTSYVLLVGSNTKFPVRLTHIKASDGDSELFTTDLYYADIYNDTGGFASWDTNDNDQFGEYDWNGEYDEVDLYPDVYLGRLACVNANEVTNTVNKIITYEENDAYTQDWFTDLVVAGGDSFPGDDNQIDEGEYVNDAVVDIMDGFIPDRVWASNGRLSGLVPTGVQELNDAINAGAGFIDFSGHGNTNVWATHPHENDGVWLPTPIGGYLNSHVQGLSNGDELPIVLIGACSVCKFAADADCFGWSFLMNPNGGGIGAMGATGLGWAYIGEYVTEGLIEGMVIHSFEAYKDEGAVTFGEMWGTAISNYIFPSMEGVDFKTVEEWEPFGDPTLAIGEESQAPLKPEDLDGPTSGKIKVEHTYTASTTDPDNDQLYYLFDWGDGEFSGWVGPYNSGETASASHKWMEKGSYEIRVKAKDVHGVQSEWSDPLPVSMPINNNYFFGSFIIQLLQNLIHRFPILEQILSNRPIISQILEL